MQTTSNHPRSSFAGKAALFSGIPYQIRTTHAFDVDQHARNLTDWKQSYDQITSGQFHGVLSELLIPHMQVLLEETNKAVRRSCCVRPDAFWFGLPANANKARINGRLCNTSTIMVRPGNLEFELVTPADYAIYGLVIQRNALLRVADQIGCTVDYTQLIKAEVLHVTELSKTIFQQTLAYMLSMRDARDEHNPVFSLALSQQAVAMALLSILDSGEVDSTISNSFIRRQRIVAQAREYMLAHREQAIIVPQLCEHLHISPRSLQYCFEDILGISPIQYLRIIRFNGARRHLRENISDRHTVQDIAADWGFWHLSQFSCDYRKLFGESPSESLRKRMTEYGAVM